MAGHPWCGADGEGGTAWAGESGEAPTDKCRLRKTILGRIKWGLHFVNQFTSASDSCNVEPGLGASGRHNREGIQIVVYRNGSANGAANGRPSLQDSTIHRLLVGSHRLAGHLNSACDQAGVSLPLARALQFLAGAHEPVRPTQLSRELGRSPAATSELIKRLVNSQQITADVDPNDRRSFLLMLTDAGRAKWHEVQGSLQHAEATIESGYGGQRLEALAGELDELVTALDKTPA